MRIFKPISISLSPNVQWDDVWLVIKILSRFLLPRAKSRGYQTKLENQFKQYLSAKYAFSFNSGRSALYMILKALEIRASDEVFLQAFTCNAVPNPVLWVGGTPIYVDIDDTLNIDPTDLEKKIQQSRARGGNPRAIITQNTFGVPAQIDKILEIARRHNLIVIEDCAHALGATVRTVGSSMGRPDRPNLIGTFGDIAFFSFGRDKVISSVWGGMITTNCHELSQKIGDICKELPFPPRSWVLKQLLHPLLFAIIIPTYYVFGKYLLAFLRIVRGVGLAVSQKERMGERPSMFPARMPHALAELALHQFEKLEKYNAHRREIAELYLGAFHNFPQPPGAIYLRFNTPHPNAKEIINEAKKKHIMLGDWYKNTIDPTGTDFEKMKYKPGSCPNAERAARESINLPTHINISKKDAERIVKYIRNYR